MTPLLVAYRRRRFSWLFVSLLLTVGLGPTLHVLAAEWGPFEALLALNLLAAIASVAREGAMRLPVVLGAGFVGARLLRAALGVPGMVPASHVLWIVGIALATLASARHALRRGAVDGERIMAALDAYLLAGLLFGVAYWLLDQLWPPSFASADPGPMHLPHAVYFSFVTMATVGYGDVVPTIPAARGLAIVQAIGGQMYLAVLVARLVALYSQHADH